MRLGTPRIMALFLLVGSILLLSACTPKTGCKITEQAQTKTTKDGTYKRSKTKSGLFPKHMRRK